MNETTLKIVDFNEICRICTNARKSLIPLFNSENEIEALAKLKACSKISITEDDGLPTKICFKCMSDLQAAYDFQILCESSDRMLRELLSKYEMEKAREIETSEVITSRDANIADAENCKNDDVADEELAAFEFVETKLHVDKGFVSHETLDYTCQPCSKRFARRYGLIRHNINKHGADPNFRESVFSCQICDFSCKKRIELLQHEKHLKHHGKSRCGDCGKYYSKSYMWEHSKTHNGVPLYLCNNCGKGFMHHTVYRKHYLHCSNAEKKHKCSFCDRQFHRMYSLTEHVRIHTNEKPFVCETCGKAFRRKTKLSLHQMSHTGVKPYTCTTCNRSFRQPTHLSEHMRVHTGDKPYVCDTCGAAFTQNHSLKSHQQRHAV